MQSWPLILGGTGPLVAMIGFLAIPLASQPGLQRFKRWMPVLIRSGLLPLNFGLMLDFIALNRMAH